MLTVAGAAVVAVAALLVVVLVTAGGDGSGAGRSADGRTPARSPFVAEGPAEVGAPAPDFSLPGLDGGTVALAHFAGKPVVVNFWASWCSPCRKEFPLLKAARAKHADDGLAIVGVSYRDIPADGRSFVAEQGADWSFARDPRGRLAAAYGVRAVPQTFFLDADGTVVSRVFGITSAADLEAEIRKILPARGR